MPLSTPLRLLIALSLLATTSFGQQQPRLPLSLTVESKESRTDAVVQFPLALQRDQPHSFHLVETTGGAETPVVVQVAPHLGRLYWIASGVTAPNARRTYRLTSESGAKGPEVSLTDSDRAVEASFEGQSLLRYNKAHVEPPSGTDPNFGRSAHLHPVRTPKGAIVTDEFPPDHLHQSGIFLAYTKTKFEDRDVDFWNLAGGKGRVRCTELKALQNGPIFAQFLVQHEHVDLTAPATDGIKATPTTGGKVALTETWDVRICTAGWKSGYWLLDIASSVSCASASPLKLPEYHYGGMAIRAARPWTPQHVRFFTSEGDERIKGNHTRPRWCDVSGLVDGQMAGATLMTHPSNFRFPEPLRIHPTMPYMVYTPQFLGNWEIQPGMPSESRYRFIIHDGQLTPEIAESLWQDYANPLVAIAN